MSIKKGIYSASMSVFNEDLSLDVDSTIKHAEKIISEGCHGAVIFGSTGMAQLISSDEKKRLIDKVSNNKLKDFFIMGTGANSLNENIQLMKYSISNGIDRFLLMPPAYYKYGDDGAYAYYANVVQIDGSTVTPKWQGGSAPTEGTANSTDTYTYTAIKTGANTYTVLASLTAFA